MGLVGKPGPMICVQGRTSLIQDRATFEDHWVPELEYWFKEGIDTPSLIMIRVDAERIQYWDGMEDGEVRL